MLDRKSVIKEFKKRWFVLQEEYMYFFNNRNDTTPIGSIPLRASTVKRLTGKGAHKNSFELYTPDGNTYTFSADSPGLVYEWLDIIRIVVSKFLSEEISTSSEINENTIKKKVRNCYVS